jgi:phosphoglycerol transferase MdoB-like AlkP superfamily enzyme
MNFRHVVPSGFSGNIYWAMVRSLALVMLLFTLCRIGFYVFNLDFFPDMTAGNFLYIMLGGLRFDLTAVLYTNALFIVMMVIPLKVRFYATYQKIARMVFYVTNGAALALNVVDFIYFKFTLRRTTADVFQQFENETNMGSLFMRFLVDYWYAMVVWVLLVMLLVFLMRRIRIHGPAIQHNVSFYAMGILALPLTFGLFVAGARSAFFHSSRPITLSDAGKYVHDPKDISLVLNTPFAIYRTIGKTKIKPVTYFAETELDSIFTPVHHPHEQDSFRYDNVVVIVMESFSKEFVGFFNHDLQNNTYQGYTPFLDSLIQHSKTFQYSFANGRKSIDALPSVVGSLPSMGVPYILSPFSGNKINSLASLLKEKGYHSAFFHGAPNGSMGFESFMNIAGFDEYYGMTEYGNDADYDGWWGIWDEKFMGFTADRINTFKEPFVSVFFSLSSHHPFSIPAEYKDRFKGGPLKLQKCIQYSDYSLRRFFEKASKMPWFRNTLFVITADHTNMSQFPEYQTNAGYFSIPIILYKSDNSLSGVDPIVVQQIDIMPTVLDYLNYDRDYIAFGNSALDTTTTHYAINFKDTYQLIEGDYLLTFDKSQSFGLFNYKQDRLFQHNLISQEPAIREKMEKKMKAIIQQYSNRMIRNDLVVRQSADSLSASIQ